MWAVMASPLIISANIRNMSTMNIETYTNAEVIAVDQDALGIQGERIMGGDLSTHGGGGGGGVEDGAPIVLAKCDAEDPNQQWVTEGQPGTRNGTVYNAATKKLWDSYDCGIDVVAWSWVTNGCEGNRGESRTRYRVPCCSGGLWCAVCSANSPRGAGRR